MDLPSNIWWVLPRQLGGMALPLIDPRRRLPGAASLEAYADQLAHLHRQGVRACVSLLDTPADGPAFEGAGLSFLCLPVANGDAPSPEQCERFVRFVDGELARARPVVAYCQAGLGRTGTLLAAYFLLKGWSASAAIARIRGIEPGAIENRRQLDFLYELERRLNAIKHATVKTGAGVMASTATGSPTVLPAPQPAGQDSQRQRPPAG